MTDGGDLTGITTADLVSWHMVAHVVVQLIAIFTFLHGIYHELLAVTSESVSAGARPRSQQRA